MQHKCVFLSCVFLKVTYKSTFISDLQKPTITRSHMANKHNLVKTRHSGLGLYLRMHVFCEYMNTCK